MRCKMSEHRLAVLRGQAFVVVALIGLCFSRSAFARLEMLEPNENRQLSALIDLRWQDKLSADDVASVLRGLQSDKNTIVEEAIDLVALHRIKEALPSLQGIKRMNLGYRVVSKILVEALHTGTDPIDPMRDLLLQQDRMDPQWLLEATDGVGSVKGKLESLVGIDEARSLRRGNKPNEKVKRIKLSGVAKQLAYYGSMKPEAVINDIFERLHNVTVAGGEYDLSFTLDTYGEKAFDLLLKKFAAVRDLNTMTGYGIHLLSLPITRYAMWHDLSAEQAARVNALIDRLDAQGSPYVAQDIFWLRKSIEMNAKKNKAAETPPAATAAP